MYKAIENSSNVILGVSSILDAYVREQSCGKVHAMS